MRIFLIVLLSLLTTIGLKAQQLNFYTPNSNKDLPQLFVYNIKQDTTGYYWLTTGEGLAKFNGKQITTPYYPDSIEVKFGSALSIFDAEIWAGNVDGKIHIFKADTLKKVLNVCDNKIIKILEFKYKKIIISQYGVYQQTKDTIIELSTAKDGQYLQDANVFNNYLYLCSNEGIETIDLKSLKKTTLIKGPYTKLTQGNNNELWAFGTKKAIRLKDKKIFSYPAEIFYQKINQVDILGNQIYIASNSGFFVYKPEEKRAVFTLVKNYNEENGLPANQVLSFNISGDDLWLSTIGNGLSYFNLRTNFTLLTNKLNMGKTIAVLSNKNNVWQVYENGISTFRYMHGYLVKTNNFSLKNTNITAACLYKGKVMLGTLDGKLYTFDKTLKETGLRGYNSIGHPILSLDAKGSTISVSVQFEGCYVNKGFGTINYNTQNGILHNDVQRTFIAKNGNIWFLCSGSGISVQKPNGATMYHLTINEGLPSIEFTDIAEDKKGNIWITTQGSGLVKINPDYEIQNFPTAAGVSSDFLYGIDFSEQDIAYFVARNSFDVLYNEGIEVFSSKSIGHVVNFSNKAVNAKGPKVLLGTDKGLLVFNAQQKPITSYNNITIAWAKANDTKTVRNGTSLRYGDYKIAIQPDIISANPLAQKNAEYKLEGFDKEWNAYNGDIIVYQSLRGGNYTLKIRFANQDKVQQQFAFYIDKPFWEKPGFYLLVILVVMAIFFVVLKIRTQRLERINAILDERVQERTSVLEERNKNLEQFSYALSHDLKNPTVNLIELVKILKLDAEGFEEDSQELVEQIEKASNHLYQNLIDFLEVLRTMNSTDDVKHLLNLKKLCKEIIDSIRLIAEQNKTSIEFNLEFTELEYNKQRLYSVLYNLITNAIKYRKPNINPVIKISSYTKDGSQYLSVQDNGLGMDLEEHGDKLFGMFNRVHTHTEGTGVGLHLVKNIVEKYGGTITVESKVNEGSNFIIKLA